MHDAHLLAKIEHLKVELDEVYHAFAGLTIEQEKLRQELLDVNGALEARVRHRTHDLETALAQAQDATRIKADFLASMSHEIRTPMNGVVGMIDLLLNTQLESKQVKMLRMARDSSLALLKIIDQILDFSKIEAGKVELDRIVFDLNRMVNNVARLFLTRADEEWLRLSCYVDPAIPPALLGDRFRLRQVLTNLVGNAVKFTPSNQERQGQVTVRVDHLGEPKENCVLLRIEVSDNGIGMSPDQLEKLFQKFSQADPSTTRRFGGTGLGLAICRGLVECMGGHIEVRSVQGLGSCFTITLSLEKAPRPLSPYRDLNGVTVIPMLTDELLCEDLSRYASFWKADVLHCADTVELRTRLTTATAVCLIMVCTEENYSELSQLCRTCSNAERLRFVLLSARCNAQFGPLQPDTLVVENYPVHRTLFIEALAIAAGRESPEVLPIIPELGAEVVSRPPPEHALAELTGRLILVVEDSPHNQLVMSMQLELLGYAADFVENGVAALAAWESKRYGLILTDCHMPEMDGYELTRQIRTLELSRGGHVPIVAVTANALQGEARHCRAVGMDDYISKPVILPKLEQLLQRWLPNQDTVDETREGKCAVQVDLESIALFEVAALSAFIGNDPESRAKLLAKFAASVPRERRELEAACSANDLALVATLAHRLKSSAKCFGAHRLAQICLVLESAATEGEETVVAQHFSHFSKCSLALEAALLAELAS